LPVFAGTPANGVGIVYLLGPTGGYILGYAFTAFLAGIFFSKRNIFYNKKNLPITFIKLAIALIPTYLIGTLWLGIIIGFDKPILEMGFYPFVISECFKILLLAILIHKYSRLKIF
jgi:biotin transport system substrate-specific component